MNKLKKEQIVAQAILDEIKPENVLSYTTCMTRLRVKAKPHFKFENLKKIDGVLGVVKVSNEDYQIILGPGFVNDVAKEFEKLLAKNPTTSNVDKSLDQKELDEKNANELLKTKATDTKSKYRKKTKGAILNFFNKISLIFTPFIAAFIAAGLLQSIGSIILIAANNQPTHVVTSVINFFTLTLSITLQILCILIGWNTSKVYGGTPIIGAVVAALFTPAFGSIVGNLFQPDASGSLSGTFLGIPIGNVNTNWLTVGIFRDGKASGLTGSIFGAMIAAGAATALEKQFNKFIPNVLKIVLVPLLTIFVILLLEIFLIVPVTGYLSYGLTWFFKAVTTNKWVTPWLGAILAGVWLWAVVFGVHQAATPIYLLLIAETGVNSLFPIVAMSGASQVGGAIALYFRAEKNGILRKQIAGALVPGILGIGEPLIYGVTLPRMKPFITCCLGAAVGGLYMGLMPIFGVIIGPNTLGPSGILAIPLMNSTTIPVWGAMLVYLSGLVVTYGVGFAITYFFGYKGVDLK